MENRPPPYSPLPVIHRKPLPLTDEHGTNDGFPSPSRQATAATATTTATSKSKTSTWTSTSSARTTDTTLTTPVTRSSGTSLSAPALPLRPASPRQFPAEIKSNAAATTTIGQSRSGLATAPAAAPEKTKPAGNDEPSFWKTALDETRFFAAGLMPRPFESTKHYTILRHTSGLVMYRGPSTNVAVTVFSTPDHPIPDNRTLWMQRRGFSGDTGLKLKTLVGASGSWLDVTPSRQVRSASDLPVADERGYQRDIGKILKKVKQGSEKMLARRVPRETLVVRIPATVADGYFRLVLCAGGTADPRTGVVSKRKVLCGSPVFRIASTSADVSIFRGASLRTLPAEAGVKIVSMIGTSYASAIAEPVVGVVQAQVEKYQPGTSKTLAAQTVYSESGLPDKLDAASSTYEERRQAAYTILHGAAGSDDNETPPDIVGPDSGPVAPFPIKFRGRVVRGTGRSTAELGVPTANLADVSDDVRMRLRGIYFGWATVRSKDGGKQISPAAGVPGAPSTSDDDDWIEALVTVGPSPWGPAAGSAAASVVERNVVAVHLLYEFGETALLDAKLKLILMGFLRPLPRATLAGSTTATISNDDALVVVTSLSRPHWGPQATLDRITSEKSGRSLSDKYIDTRGKLQKQVDKIPLHWAGVRTSGSELRDNLYGNGGYWIAR